MAKQNILIVDADPESIQVLEVSLKKSGYSVTKAENGVSALEIMSYSIPDLIISDTKMSQMDGFEFCTKLKENEDWAGIPFIFLTAEKSIEDKIRGLELGVEDYLTKPIFIREILARVSLGIQRRQKERLERRETKSKFSGNLQDMGVVDLLQTIELGHKTGIIDLIKEDDRGEIIFKEGKVIDARTRRRNAEDAVYRMLVWSDGTFEIEFQPVEHSPKIKLSTQGLLMEGMRRLDEWGRLLEQLPPLTSVFDVDEQILTERLGEIPDAVNSVLKNFDGKSTLMDVVDKGTLGDLEALTVITKLYFEGLICETPKEAFEQDHAETTSSISKDVIPDYAPDAAETEALPSKVVDDAIGPHLSVAAPGIGFVEALTHSPSPAASATDSPEPPLAQPQESASTATPEVLDSDRGSRPGTVPGMSPPADVQSTDKTMLGLKRVDLEASEEITSHDKEKKETLSDAKLADSKDSQIEIIESSSTKERIDNTAQRIATAIDEGAPPPSQSIPPNKENEDEEYFEASAYKKSMAGPPSYEPEVLRGEEDQEEEEDFEDDEEEMEEDDWEEPSNLLRNALIGLAAVVVIGLGSFGAFWYWQKDQKENLFDSAPIVNTPQKEYQSALLVGQNHSPTQQPASPLNATQSESPNPDVSSNDSSKEEEVASSSAGTDQELPVESTDIPQNKEPPQEEASPPPAAGAQQAPSAEPEAKEETPSNEGYAAIMAKVKRSGRRRKITLLREALTLVPNSDEAMAQLAVQLMENAKSRNEAFDLAKRAVEINDSNAIAWMAVGYINQLNRNNEAAQQAYKKCAEGKGPRMYTAECRRLAR